MAFAFSTKDERYHGPNVLPLGAAIPRARVFVDHLPPGLPAERYNPYLVKDRYSHRPRYVIESTIIVRTEFLVLVVRTNQGGVSISQKTAEFIYNTSIARNGLEVLIIDDNCDYQGVLYPIPDPPTDAHQQHKARQRLRHP